MEDQVSSSESSLKKWLKNPIFLGTLIGFLAAFMQALLFSAGGPEAYGFCVACHSRDLINDFINKIFRTNLGVAPISKNAILPSLSIIGVMIGALIAAKGHKEFKIKTGSWKSYLLYFFGGIFVLIFALIVGGCPYRNALRMGYGDIVAFIGIISMGVGVFIGVKVLLVQLEKNMEDDL